MKFSKFAKFYCTIQDRVFQKTLARRFSLAGNSESDVTESSSDSVKFITGFSIVMIYITAGYALSSSLNYFLVLTITF